jgi:hypothetical protein
MIKQTQPLNSGHLKARLKELFNLPFSTFNTFTVGITDDKILITVDTENDLKLFGRQKIEEFQNQYGKITEVILKNTGEENEWNIF